jgi:drug/metabolite transporter (DMT)-like permease
VLGFLALIGTAVAFLAWFTEVRRSPLGQVAAWTFFVPVFGVAFGLLIVGERPHGWTLVGLSLVLVSMWVVIHAPLPSGAQVDPVE